jgi:hypothetical protein
MQRRLSSCQTGAIDVRAICVLVGAVDAINQAIGVLALCEGTVSIGVEQWTPSIGAFDVRAIRV